VAGDEPRGVRGDEDDGAGGLLGAPDPAEALAGEILIGVPNSNSPALRAVVDAYGARIGVDLTPDHEALNIAMGISLIASTGGIGVLPLYARNLMPPAVVSRPLTGVPPTIDLTLGYNEANTSPLLKDPAFAGG
jgi:LysR family hca operon transcriptional activator